VAHRNQKRGGLVVFSFLFQATLRNNNKKKQPKHDDEVVTVKMAAV